MKNGICPKCNAASVYRRQNNNGPYGINTVPVGGVLGGTIAPVDTYVCTRCGYYENYIRDGKKLIYIAEHWEHIAPRSAPSAAPDSGDTRRLR